MTDGEATRVEKPWGYELIWAKTGRYVGKVIHVRAGHALSLQYHNRKEETLLLWSGRLLFELGPAGRTRRWEMQPGDRVHIAPGTVHRMTAIDDSDVFEVSTPELEDVVRLDDRYGREGTTDA
ncbi:MAG: cupin domain-containing protein [Acidobacteria bacterium]|nr:cupin domain-containing protein [Acidobacteriota bacterium]MYH28217.1 cupin domain-containing protein [Acidobacteriota bacterium]MYK90341.1 cupin domain-containing protein [Acidobacteriota bacterium]